MGCDNTAKCLADILYVDHICTMWIYCTKSREQRTCLICLCIDCGSVEKWMDQT